MIWASAMPLWKKAAMTLQMCQFAFYMLAFTSAAISLTLMWYGRGLLSGRRAAGPDGDRARDLSRPSAISISASACWAASVRTSCIAALLLAVVFPSGLILANTRATFEAFFCTPHGFHTAPLRVGEIQTAAGAACPNWWSAWCCRSSPSPNPTGARCSSSSPSRAWFPSAPWAPSAPRAGAPADHARRIALSCDRDGKRQVNAAPHAFS